ncbi:oligomeric complex COG6 [Xylona heveae TC161]|uniref:Conserved oligomeric Golgi complex subunit 6 n=1 Tax=Xylona heveae (strain CBS 132557 / TC161) TaxID=1328760 RepID=A0A165G8K0_XYLHT|nr:oligomeric complex COG6 [Xylona heveae TC161]KZF21870.1 oligomeric complex COG6 [Xylona heveae TC161]
MTTGYFSERRESLPLDRLDDGLSPGPYSVSPGSPATPTGAVSRPSNALANRVTAVLSASYSDLDIRDALEVLDAKKFENTPETRRRLRLDVQREVIDCNGEIIKEFGKVAEQLKRIGSTIESLNNCCNDMRKHISAARQETGPVLEEAATVMEQKRQEEVKQKLLDAFNTHFILSEQDMLSLTSTAEPVDERFFDTLGRAKRIHADCQVLLGTENQRLGLELLEQCSKAVNSAYQKLYRWIERQFKTLNLENPQLSSSIRRALRVLAEKPALFQTCLDLFAESREYVLSDSFYTALTGIASEGGKQSSVKPIELYAHDPLRYVGDMLAWTHSAAVSEREALEVLFIAEGEQIARGIQAGINSEPWALRSDGETEVFDGVKALNQLVSRGLAGVARLLKQRTEQVIQSHEESILAYKIYNLVGFYVATFSRLLSPESPVLEVLEGLSKTAMDKFRSTMRDHITAVQGDLVQAPIDLAVPESLRGVLNDLSALMKSYDTSLTPTESREASFEPILLDVLEPYLDSSEGLAKTLDEPQNSIFIVNCMLAARDTLSSFTFTEEKIIALEKTIQEHASRLKEYLHGYFIHMSGLGPLLRAILALSDAKDDISAIPSLEPFQPPKLQAASQTLDDFLPSALMDASENIKRLQNSRMVQSITEEAADRFCSDFELLEARILASDELRADKESDEDGEIGPLRSFFPRTSAEIRVLLS